MIKIRISERQKPRKSVTLTPIKIINIDSFIVINEQ